MPSQKRFVFALWIRWSAPVFLTLALSGCQMMNGHAANNLGSSYYREGNYAAARQSFYQAVAEMPENPDFRYNLAAAMQKQGDLAGAEQIYRQVLHIDPAHQPSYHGVAQLMIQQGRQAEATALLNSWVATQPYSATPHVEMAWLQQEQGDQFAAAQSLETALKLEPNHPVALAQMGQVYHESGQPELAAAYYQRSLQGNWRQPEVQNRLAALSKNPSSRQSTQVAFGVPQTMMASGQPLGPQTAWMPPQNQFTRFPATAASLPNGMMAQPPMLAANPAGPSQSFAPPPQVQTAWMPPQLATPAPQPTPVALPQQFVQEPTPVDQPTFATTPPNADPAHVPSMAAGLPVVQPY